MRLLTLLPYIALLPSFAYAGPLGYNLRRHDEGRKQLITTVMVFTKTMVLEIDLPPVTTTTVSTEPIPPPAESTPAPGENVPEVTVTQVVTVTKKKTATHEQPLAPSTTESITETLSRLRPLPTTKKEKTTAYTGTSTTSVPVSEVTEPPSPPPEVPTHQPTSTYILSRLKPLPDPEGPVENTTAPADPTTTETTIAETTNAKTTTEPTPTPIPEPDQSSSSLPEIPTTTGFVPPTDPPNIGPSFKENVPIAIKRNQEYNELKEGDECDPSASILACEGTMGKSILQCDATKKYKSVLPCLRDTRCFATPQLLAPGVLVTCDTPEAAGKKFNMSAEELLKEIQGGGYGNGKEKEKEKEKEKDEYKRKRRLGADSSLLKRAYNEVHSPL
ncbi:hypothetical protein L211DRAFT_550442 [Terfezia boudieri ATCC MYA-4762]|uniref:Carbohydrate-binding module family 19 domain-containing protein n=1 Tax=Terfezia boudieri ATCC MYA-4762 TaxID=1051890 RepID=A0A3N4M0X3_9PEZI|nr:hypothetical protein L211DRAFT_550442 [Terfezia boudieri ATCC MYA-4762]